MARPHVNGGALSLNRHKPQRKHTKTRCQGPEVGNTGIPDHNHWRLSAAHGDLAAYLPLQSFAVQRTPSPIAKPLEETSNALSNKIEPHGRKARPVLHPRRSHLALHRRPAKKSKTDCPGDLWRHGPSSQGTDPQVEELLNLR